MSETTRQRVEAEAEELYPDPTHYGYTENLRIARGWLRAAHVRAKTVTAEQIEAGAKAIHADGGITEDLQPGCATCDRSLTLSRAAFTAAGFIVEGES